MRIEPGIAARVPTPGIFGTDPIATCAALVSANAAPRGLQIRFREKPKFVTARSAAKRRINGPGDKTRRISRCNRMRPAQRIPAHPGTVQSHAKNTSTSAGERTSHASRFGAGRIDPLSLTSIGSRCPRSSARHLVPLESKAAKALSLGIRLDRERRRALRRVSALVARRRDAKVSLREAALGEKAVLSGCGFNHLLETFHG